MTLNGAIMQLVEMRENSMMPEVFKPYLDKVIETVSECGEPSAQPEIVRCKDCKHWFDIDDGRQKHRMCADIYGDWYCADAERRTDEESNIS